MGWTRSWMALCCWLSEMTLGLCRHMSVRLRPYVAARSHASQPRSFRIFTRFSATNVFCCMLPVYNTADQLLLLQRQYNCIVRHIVTSVQLYYKTYSSKNFECPTGLINLRTTPSCRHVTHYWLISAERCATLSEGHIMATDRGNRTMYCTACFYVLVTVN